MNVDEMTEREMDAAIADHLTSTEIDKGTYRIGISVYEYKYWHIGRCRFDADSLPMYSKDANATREMEAEIQRRGLCESYVFALLDIINPEYDHVDSPSTLGLWHLITATPAQRCRAALRVVLK